MKVGDQWELYIPYQLGYGKDGYSDIPGYSTLIFNVNLVGSGQDAADNGVFEPRFAGCPA